MAEEENVKLQHCVEFIKAKYAEHAAHERPAPLLVGLSGIQGCGKSTLASSIAHRLCSKANSLLTCVLSFDDFYLPHALQSQLSKIHADNVLLRFRGQPSTHDLPLAVSVLASLKSCKPTRLPTYDKSAFEGQGDRASQDHWTDVNSSRQLTVRIIILEGWCCGFRPLSEDELHHKWLEAVRAATQEHYAGRLGLIRFEDLQFINSALSLYDELTNQFDAFIHLDTEDLSVAYRWRSQQESELRQLRGSGMTKEQVIAFVDVYYPSYELYVDELRTGCLHGRGNQLRLVMNAKRTLMEVVVI